MVQFARKHDNLQEDMIVCKMVVCKIVGMDAINKNMIHGLDLNGMWIYVITRVEDT